MAREDYPDICGITEKQAARLRDALEKPLQVELHGQFEDDHCPCLNVKIAGVKLSIWWLGNEEAAAFYFHDDSPRAREVIRRVIEGQLAFRDEHKDE
jgi:hypothetical protein